MKTKSLKPVFVSSAAVLIMLFLPVSSFCQSNSNGETPQFLFGDFSVGTVKMKNGSMQKIDLNYNMVSEKMVYRKDGSLYDMINLELVDTVFLENSKFIHVAGAFYEVLYVAPSSLFVQYSGSIIPPGTPAGYGGTSQVSNTKNLTSVELSSGYYNLNLPKDYTVNVTKKYWIKTGEKMESFLSERQLLKLYPDIEDQLKGYIKKNKLKFEKESDMVRLITFYNTLTK
jgi:hypothetical protein